MYRAPRKVSTVGVDSILGPLPVNVSKLSTSLHPKALQHLKGQLGESVRASTQSQKNAVKLSRKINFKFIQESITLQPSGCYL